MVPIGDPYKGGPTGAPIGDPYKGAPIGDPYRVPYKGAPIGDPYRGTPIGVPYRGPIAKVNTVAGGGSGWLGPDPLPPLFLTFKF